MRRALAGLPVTVVENPNFRDGMSTSLRAGVAVLPADVDGCVVLLGDQPEDLDLFVAQQHFRLRVDDDQRLAAG